MPILNSAKKALRNAEHKTQVNRLVKSRLKTALDSVKATPSTDAMAEAFSSVDKAVRRHLMHANKAARLKSQLSKLGVVAAPAKAAKPAVKAKAAKPAKKKTK